MYAEQEAADRRRYAGECEDLGLDCTEKPRAGRGRGRGDGGAEGGAGRGKVGSVCLCVVCVCVRVRVRARASDRGHAARGDERMLSRAGPRSGESTATE